MSRTGNAPDVFAKFRIIYTAAGQRSGPQKRPLSRTPPSGESLSDRGVINFMREFAVIRVKTTRGFPYH